MTAQPKAGLTRRTLVQGAAWTVPAIVIAPAAQAATASKPATSTVPPPVFGIVPGSYVVKIPAGIDYVNYDIAGARGGQAVQPFGTGMRLRGNSVDSWAKIDLRARSRNGLDTYLVVKVGSSGKQKGEAADDSYRRGASLGGFGTRQYQSDGSAVMVGGDGGGSTGVFLAAQQPTAPGQTIAVSHAVGFNRALLVAAGGPGSSLNQSRIWPSYPNDPVGATESYPAMAASGTDRPWAQASGGQLPGYLFNASGGDPDVVTANGAELMRLPNGTIPDGLSAPVNTFADPGNTPFRGVTPYDTEQGTTSLWVINDAKSNADGGHGGNAPFSTAGTGSLPVPSGDKQNDWVLGAGGGGGGWVGGASGMAFQSSSVSNQFGQTIYRRSYGSSGAPGTSFFTDQAFGNETYTTPKGATVTGVRILRGKTADPGTVFRPQRNLNDSDDQFAGVTGATGFEKHNAYFKFWWGAGDINTAVFADPSAAQASVEFLDIV